MSSIFGDIDRQVNPGNSFWCPLESYVLQDITENKLFSSKLKIMKSRDHWKERTIFLTTTSLYYCKKNTENPKKMTVIKWKKVEAFTEDNEIEERFGIKIGQGTIYEEFYTESVEMLENWLVNLSKVAIMIDFEEDYAIIKEVGKGNYATVFLVQDLENYQKFAVKQINKEVVKKSSRGPSAVISEIEIMRKISHPMMVKLYRIYENDDFVSLVLDYVEGGDLFHRIQKKEKFPEQTAGIFISNMLEGLKYLHSLNIVHRDLKPENLLMVSIEDDTEFKLCDFGLACIAGDDQVLRCGSPGYVAPEILMKKAYNNKVDIFSAGIILYIILSGRAPFYGKTSNEILIKNKECRLQFHDKYWREVSKDAVDMVLRLTDPDPNTRVSAEYALRHPWLQNINKAMSLLSPFPSNPNIEGSPECGASFALMKRINDRREMGAEVVFGNVEPGRIPKEHLKESKNANEVLKKLREDDNL
ncbi:hypothetical protein SteCoe_15854 [Stentor coeruleus]|uniref:Protein kinase domain-containing protein n=1 Tax=Stentor coeruleus TaxID=5963 RepID=A0A1R2C2N5_9CILI|nr:hypothetical protein SteCoe_15854 [Stentor coeruleus]